MLKKKIGRTASVALLIKFAVTACGNVYMMNFAIEIPLLDVKAETEKPHPTGISSLQKLIMEIRTPTLFTSISTFWWGLTSH